jgi:hypothetical protein
MKKRLTKKNRNDLVRKKAKKIKRLKEKSELIINIPQEISFLKQRAVLTCILAGVTVFIVSNSFAFAQPSDYENAMPEARLLAEPQAHILKNNIEKTDNTAKKINQVMPHEEVGSKYIDLNKKISPIIDGTPMSAMKDEILKRDKPVAAFLVGIAMKESKFGRYSPKKNGEDCFNYWGYRGRENTTASGYSCFDSPEHAIKVVGDRIESMVKRGANTPAEMISWKCGSSCAGHDPASVKKWITDVGIHYYQINSEIEIAKK